MGRGMRMGISRRTLMALGLMAAMPWRAEAAPKSESKPDKAKPESAKSGSAKPAAKLVPSPAAQASAHLGFDLISALGKAAPGEPNLVVSPASLAAAFCLLDIGASPKLRTALVKTLRLGGKAGDLSKLRPALAPLIAGGKEGSPLSGIGAVYFDQGTAPRPAALAKLKQAGATAEVADFASPATLEAINALVKERTQGLIPTLIDAPLRKGGLVVLNALHFKDEWRMAFDPAQTSEADFLRAGGEGAKVTMMHSGPAPRLARQDGRFVGVVLPYRTKGYSLIAVTTTDKPADLAEFAEVVGWLAGEGFAETKVSVALPRLAIKAGGNLRDSLDGLGLDPAAKAPDALQQFSAKPQTIDEIIQKVAITIDEKGTEAAAATAITSRGLSDEEYVTFAANKPFLFALRDEASGQTLMAGYVGDASKAQ